MSRYLDLIEAIEAAEAATSPNRQEREKSEESEKTPVLAFPDPLERARRHADRKARTKARLKGALCSVHGPATAWTTNDRGDAWCSLCFPPGGAS